MRFLRLTQDDAGTESAKHLERNFSLDTLIANRLCMSVDIRYGECFASAASNSTVELPNSGISSEALPACMEKAPAAREGENAAAGQGFRARVSGKEPG